MTGAAGKTPDPAPSWHCQSAEAVLGDLHANADRGLDSAEAARRLRLHGRNEIVEQRRRPLWRMLLDQFTDFMILVLIAAALISGIIGEPVDAAAIVVIVLLNAVIGFVQEYRAERAVAALRRMAAPSARVLREGTWQTRPAVELVPGDLVQLEAGDIVPADLRLLGGDALAVDESALTGESEPVAKSEATLADPELPLADRRNMAYKGTKVTRGRAQGVLVTTGMATELGRIATLLRKQEVSRTPLQQRLARFGRHLAIAVLAICAVIFLAGVLRGEPVTLMFLTAVSLAVAAIPEALPAVVTISLALGARKMVEQHALIRRLPAVETLGSVTYICSDKTGTLTENRMRAESFFADGQLQPALPEPDDGPWTELGRCLALNHDVSTEGDGALHGDPTEVALVEAAATGGYQADTLESQLPRFGAIPFDAERQRMTTLHRDGDGAVAYVKGAPEALLPLCTDALASAGRQPLLLQAVLEQARELANQGYRVLACALRRWERVPAQTDAEAIEQQLSFIGLVALLDPPRAEAAAAVEECRRAGITPVMITGDHPGTALAIARRLGITDGRDEAVTGSELRDGNRADLDAHLARVAVFARVTPEQKIDIVEALQRRGEFVAMTGDGVNDAPALKRADIGVAMGQKGTDVAREAADMVLLDDNFATIVAAVREGRRIYDNIRKFVRYTMTSNAGEIWTLFLAPFLGLPIPLIPIQILWINLVTDGLPGLALTVERAEPGIMARPPRPPRESIFSGGLWQQIVWIGLLIGGLSIATQAWAIETGSTHWQTMVFTVLTFSQLANALAIRSERESLLRIGLFSNLPLLGAIALTVVLQLAIIYLPWLNAVFKTQPLDASELLLCLTLPLVVLVAVEIEKALIRRGLLYDIAIPS